MLKGLKSVPFAYKLGAIVVLSLIPVGLLGYFFYDSTETTLETADRELAGLHYYHPLEELLLRVGEHESISVSAALGVAKLGERISTIRNDINVVINEMDGARPAFGGDAGETERRWNSVKSDWQRVQSTSSSNADALIDAHTSLKDSIRGFRDYVASTSGLTLDPNAVTYYVADSAVFKIPDFMRYCETVANNYRL